MRFASLLLLAIGAAVASTYYAKNRRPINRVSPSEQDEDIKAKLKHVESWSDREIDERLDDSFPASDPPSWSSEHLH